MVFLLIIKYGNLGLTCNLESNPRLDLETKMKLLLAYYQI